MLNDFSGADQFCPWIAVDGMGGSNVLYYTSHRPPTDDAPVTFLKPMYARIASFTGVSSTVQSVRVLKPSGADDAFYVDVSDDTNIGDYQCFMNLYLGGDPRANCDGSAGSTLDIRDFLCFQEKFVAGCQ